MQLGYKMIGTSWIFLSGIFLAAANTTISEQENKYKTAEMALVSVLGLNNTDHVDNINFLDKVEKVIGNIKSVFESKTSIRPSDDDVKLEKFIDFIQNLIKRLNKYDDTDLKHFCTILNDEIRKYHYRGCKFHELLENYNLRTYLSNLLNNLQTQPGAAIKSNLEAIANKIEDEKFNRNEKNLVEFINSMYRQDSVEKFQNFLVKIDTYRLSTDTEKMDLDLVKIIKEGLRSIIFDYYSQLNNNARSTLKYQLNDFWINFSQNMSFTSVDSFKSFKAQKGENLVKTKNKLTTKHIYNNSNEDLKHDEHGNMKSQVKEQSIYLSNSIKTTKSDKTPFKRFKNDGYINNDQTMLPDDRFIYIKNLKLDENSGLQTKSTIIYKTRYLDTSRKKLTFKTLYPDLEAEWTSVIPVPSRRYMSFRSPMHHHNTKRRKLIRKYGRVKDRRLVKESGVNPKVGVVSSHVPRIKTQSFRHKVAVNKFGLRSRKTGRQITTYKTKQQKSMHPFRIKKKLTTFKRSRLRIRPQNSMFTQRANHYKRFSKKDSIISEEGLSIDFSEVHHNFRRSNTNFTPSNPGLRKAQMTQGTSVAVNNETHNTTIIITDVNNELLNDKDTFIRSQEKQKYDTDNESLKKSEKRFQIKTRVDDKELRDVKENKKTIDVTTQPNYNWDADKKLVKEKNNVTYTRQNKQDESPIFNYRATHSSNETEIESKKNEINRVTQNKITFIMNDSKEIKLDNNNEIRKSEKEEKLEVNEENQQSKDADVKNIKTDNDFKTFIEDYGNDLDEFKRNKEKIGNDKVTVRSEFVNNIEKYIDTSSIITTKTTLPSTTSTSHTKKFMTSLSTVVTTKPPAIVASIIPSLNEKQDLSHHDTTIRSFFDANLLKHLMKTTTIPTTTQYLEVLGRYFHHDGVLVDSMEELKEEVAEATNLNYEEEQ